MKGFLRGRFLGGSCGEMGGSVYFRGWVMVVIGGSFSFRGSVMVGVGGSLSFRGLILIYSISVRREIRETRLRAGFP